MRAHHHKGPMDQFSAHLDRGWDLVARGDLAGALVSARKTLELDAESPEALNLLGYIQAAEGNAEEALEQYRSAIEADETFVEAMLNAAEVLLHPLGHHQDALDMIEDALDYCQLDDEIADALLLKIDVLLHAGQREEAARVVSELPAGPFENRHLEFLMGRARYEVGDLSGATPLIERAVQGDPDNAEAHYYHGMLLEAAGRGREATVAFLRAREVDQNAPPPPWSLPVEQFELRVQSAISRLTPEHASWLEGALVVVGDSPGAEVVADGVDPRVAVLLDDVRTGDEQRVGRLFVYQRNVERFAGGPHELEQEIVQGLTRELTAVADAAGSIEALPDAGEPETKPDPDAA